MSDTKWIKIVVDIFDDEKMLLIETMPEADAIIVIWFKLLCMAGKQANKGVFLLNGRIPYNASMFAVLFKRKETVISLAFSIFEKYGMIEIVNNVVTIPNWGKHQTMDKIERNKEYMKNYMRERRREQKLIVQSGQSGETDTTLPSEDHNTLPPLLSYDPSTLPSKRPNVITNGDIGTVNAVKVNSKNNRKTNVSSADKNKQERDRREIENTPLEGGMGRMSTSQNGHKRDPVKRAMWDQYASQFSPELKAAVLKWLTYKKERRENYRAQGFDALLSKILEKSAKYGNAALISVIEDSMSNGYQGITWDKLVGKKSSEQNRTRDSALVRKNRFCNFQQRDKDMTALEQEERDYLARELEERADSIPRRGLGWADSQ